MKRKFLAKIVKALIEGKPSRSRSEIVHELSDELVKARRSELTDRLIKEFALTVQAGPFSGMLLLSEAASRDGDIAPKLLGTYEQELTEAITNIVSSKPKRVVNVGSGEGHYAIGLARNLPGTQVIAFESSEKARSICHRAAEINHVSIEIKGECTIDEFSKAMEKPATVFMDCEGAELQLLQPNLIPALHESDILVECHDVLYPNITSTLTSRFEGTHRIKFIGEGTRQSVPHSSLADWPSVDRWLAICEFRPVAMNWLFMQARLGVGRSNPQSDEIVSGDPAP